MATCLKIGLIVGLLMSLPPASISEQTFVEMEVIGVTLDGIGQNPVVMLANKEKQRILPIWIGLPEAGAIERELKNTPSVRPMTHDLLHSILGRMKVAVKEVRIVELKGQTFHASLFLISNKELLEVDARPSDAIILALKSRAPVFVSTEILDKQGVGLTKGEASGERYGIRVQHLTPSLASHFNFKGQKGILVSGVVPGSVSEASGIRVGDIITRIGLKEVENVKDFDEILDGLKDAHSIPISVFRDGISKEATLSLKP